MKIRMRIDVAGTFHTYEAGVHRGDEVDVPDDEGARYCKLGYAEPVVDEKVERAVLDDGEKRAKRRPRTKSDVE